MDFLSTLRNLGIEAKASLFFAALALFFSILFGVINGIGMGAVLLRSLFLTVLFAGLGFAVISVFKKYVPELYALISGIGAAGPAPQKKEPVTPETPGVEIPDISGGEDKAAGQPVKEGKEAAISPMSDEDFNAMMGEGGAESKRKLGKHIISNEKIISYEPKIMAQAVRTMMRRDED